MQPAVAIGTAQFGLDYGVTNQDGKVATSEVAAIIDYAHDRAVRWLDTAAAYGDAEAVIANEQRAAGFQICTKVGAKGTTAASDLERELNASLVRLRRERVDILLLHCPDALAAAHAEEVLAWAAREKTAGRIGAFGVSLYRADEEPLTLLPGIDWVQLPISILSQEWVSSGALGRLRARGIKIQARSLLAQGLLGVGPESLPEPLQEIRESLVRLRVAAAAYDSNPVALAFAFAAQLPVDMLVVGVQSVSQLAACLDALRVQIELDWTSFACDPGTLDPRGWPAGLKI